MNTFPRREIVDRIKKEYPVGCRVELDYMKDPYRNLEPGTKGTVKIVDDVGTVHVNWDCGSTLGVVYGEDKCHRIMKKRTCPKCSSEYSEPPALSRADNKTEICPKCGMMEAVGSIPAGAVDRQQLAELEKFIMTNGN